MQILYPTLVQENLIQRVRAVLGERSERLRRIRTSRQARGYCDQVRRKIKRCFGPLPKKTSLNARVLSKTECDGVVLQNIVFESRPGFLVTGNLYIPEGQGRVSTTLASHYAI